LRFVTQTSDPSDFRCGAFSIAYYQWLKAGKTYSSNEAADYAVVDAIYYQIKFGNLYNAVAVTGMGTHNMSGASSPLNMLHYIVNQSLNTGAEFFIDDSNPAMNDIYNAIRTNDGELLASYSSKLKTGGIPTLRIGQYAIVVFLISMPNGAPVDLHWVLFYRNSNGYEFYDPFFGTALSATESQMKGSEPILVTYPGFGDRILTSMNSCLLLP